LNSFTFYVTFHPKACPPEQPITIGFERVTTSLLNSIKGYRRVFMHSGNWWRLSERIRTPSRILSSLRKLSEVCNVEGFMSIYGISQRRLGRELLRGVLSMQTYYSSPPPRPPYTAPMKWALWRIQ